MISIVNNLSSILQTFYQEAGSWTQGQSWGHEGGEEKVLPAFPHLAGTCPFQNAERRIQPPQRSPNAQTRTEEMKRNVSFLLTGVKYIRPFLPLSSVQCRGIEASSQCCATIPTL